MRCGTQSGISISRSGVIKNLRRSNAKSGAFFIYCIYLRETFASTLCNNLNLSSPFSNKHFTRRRRKKYIKLNADFEARFSCIYFWSCFHDVGPRAEQQCTFIVAHLFRVSNFGNKSGGRADESGPGASSGAQMHYE
jgi:hypothetical protein